MRSSRDMVTFHHPFTLRGLDAEQPAGTYMVITEDEEIPGLTFLAWRRVATQIYLPAIGLEQGQQQVVTIDPKDLAACRRLDAERFVP